MASFSIRRELLSLLAGLAAGAALLVATRALSASDIGGPGWSLRGNGALVVTFAGGPAVLAGGWLWLALRTRQPAPHGERRSARRDQSGAARALAGAACTLLLALVLGFGPILLFLFSSGGALLSMGLSGVVLGLALVVGLALAAGRGWRAGGVVAAVAIGVTLLVPGMGAILAPLALPFVVAAPTLAQRWSSRLAADSGLLLLGLLVGVYGSQRLLPSG